MRLLAFGKLSHLNVDDLAVPPTVTDTDALRRFLGQRWPQIAAPEIRIAVNQTLVQGVVPLSPDDEIAFLPPMSGG
ncbi:MAG TPA: MoaD/ThiS family protein [Sphingomicrobium sp.]|nr:MoaD/ThiS family protein [Sphingomicrobium sp.]